MLMMLMFLRDLAIEYFGHTDCPDQYAGKNGLSHRFWATDHSFRIPS